MLLKVADIDKKIVKILKSRHVFSKNFEITIFCERPHNDSKFENNPQIFSQNC